MICNWILRKWWCNVQLQIYTYILVNLCNCNHSLFILALFIWLFFRLKTFLPTTLPCWKGWIEFYCEVQIYSYISNIRSECSSCRISVDSRIDRLNGTWCCFPIAQILQFFKAFSSLWNFMPSTKFFVDVNARYPAWPYRLCHMTNSCDCSPVARKHFPVSAINLYTPFTGFYFAITSLRPLKILHPVSSNTTWSQP